MLPTKMLALLSKQGTACDETGICNQCDTHDNRSSIEALVLQQNRSKPGNPDNPIIGTWADCSQNDAIACHVCGSRLASKRTFYRTVVQIEILSEEPTDFDNDLEAISEAITTGDCSGTVAETTTNEKVDGPTMAKLLKAQGSDPSFFQLTDDGEDTDEL